MAYKKPSWKEKIARKVDKKREERKYYKGIEKAERTAAKKEYRTERARERGKRAGVPIDVRIVRKAAPAIKRGGTFIAKQAAEAGTKYAERERSRPAQRREPAYQGPSMDLGMGRRNGNGGMDMGVDLNAILGTPRRRRKPSNKRRKKRR